MADTTMPKLLSVLEDIVNAHDMGDGVTCSWCGRVLEGPACTSDDCLGVRAWSVLREANPEKYGRTHEDERS